MSVNKVILVGNVGHDPDIKYDNGKPIVQISLATNEPARTLADGSTVPQLTEWHRLVLWGDNAAIAERYITKGTKLYVEGRLRSRRWQDHNAITRTITEILVDTLDILARAPQNPV